MDVVEVYVLNASNVAITGTEFLSVELCCIVDHDEQGLIVSECTRCGARKRDVEPQASTASAGSKSKEATWLLAVTASDRLQRRQGSCRWRNRWVQGWFSFWVGCYGLGAKESARERHDMPAFVFRAASAEVFTGRGFAGVAFVSVLARPARHPLIAAIVRAERTHSATCRALPMDTVRVIISLHGRAFPWVALQRPSISAALDFLPQRGDPAAGGNRQVPHRAAIGG